MDLELIRKNIKEDLLNLENEIENNIKTNVELINTLSKHIISGGGKRLRPTLLLLSSMCCNENNDKRIKASVVVEFIHAATLLHDDVVDESIVRHGKKTANSVWGNKTAVLVGDFLYSRAFEIIVELGMERIYETLSKTTNIISQGEVLQLMNLNNLNITEESYMEVIYKKTAKLFEASAEIGSILAGDIKEQSISLSEYGHHFGLAYQLRNDLLDYFGEEKHTGKNLTEDLTEGKTTLPLIRAMKVASRSEKKIIEQSFLDKKNIDGKKIIEILKNNKIDEYMQNIINDETNKAIKSIDKLKKNNYIEDLINLVTYCATRNK